MNLSTDSDRTLGMEKNNFLQKLIKAMFVKGKIRTPIYYTQENRELMDSLNKTRREWILANSNFEYAHAKEMIDYYVYTIKAHEVMYEYLIKKAKERGIKAEPLENSPVIYIDRQHKGYLNQ